MADSLPPGFEDLEPFLSWAQSTEFARNKKRWTSTLAESQAFYDIMLRRAPDALAYLDETPLGDMSPAQRRLLDMCLALTECAVTIEMYGDPQPKYVFPIDRFVPVHDSWPLTGGAGR